MLKKRAVPVFAFPRRRPKTIRALYRFHRVLLELTMLSEFRQKALVAAGAEVTGQMRKYSPRASDPEDGVAARLALSQLNKLRSNLLHEPGWVREVAVADGLARHGKAAFLTFGTPVDAGNAIVFDRPLCRLKWGRIPWATRFVEHLKS